MSQLPPPPGTAGYYPQQVIVYQGTHGLAIFSGLAGILSWFICPFVGALAAIITGHIALADLKHSPRPGRGWAIAGLILGYLHLAVYGLIAFLVLALGFGTIAMLGSSPTPTP